MKPFIRELVIDAPVEFVYDYLCDIERELSKHNHITEAAYDTSEPGGRSVVTYQVDTALALVRVITHYLEKKQNKYMKTLIKFPKYAVQETIYLRPEGEDKTRIRLEFEPKPDGFFAFTSFGLQAWNSKKHAANLLEEKMNFVVKDLTDLYKRSRDTYAPFPTRYRVQPEQLEQILSNTAQLIQV